VYRRPQTCYGAQLHHLGATTLELAVAGPPATVTEVAQVAVEQYAYLCRQGLGAFDELASFEAGAGADEGDEVGCVHGPPAGSGPTRRA
jgi:hypothetical protein